MTFPFVDLFAGIGGFHAVLRSLGGQLAAAAEIDARAAAIYQANWGADPTNDVVALARVPEESVPPHAVLAAGFPCQPFSKSGRQLGMAESRGTMFGEVLRIAEVRRPPVIILENVRNIAGPRQRESWKTIVSGLRKAGYRTPNEPAVFSPHLLPPQMGGTPQHRERAYILGTYVGVDRAMVETDIQPIIAREPQDGWRPEDWDLERDLLQEEHEIDQRDRYLFSADEVEAIEIWNRFLECTKDLQLPGFPMWSACWEPRAMVDALAPPWKQRFQRKNIEFYQANKRAIDRWLADVPNLRVLPPSRQKFEWQAGNTVRDLRACLLQFRPSGIRAKRPNYTPTLVAIGQTPLVGMRGRRLTAREAARLQGFPDWFSFADQPLAVTYKQLGNAINIAVAYQVLVRHIVRDEDDILSTAQEREDDLGLVHLVKAAREAPERPLIRRDSEVEW